MDVPWVGFMRALAVRVTVALWLALLLALPCDGQNTSGSGQPTVHQMQVPPANMDGSQAGDAGDSVMEERRLRQFSVAQHKSMVDDTNKLLKLVTELNAEISRTNPSSLTPEELHKVAEIEKLAHSVRDKMRTSLKGVPDILDSTPLIPISHR